MAEKEADKPAEWEELDEGSVVKRIKGQGKGKVGIVIKKFSTSGTINIKYRGGLIARFVKADCFTKIN